MTASQLAQLDTLRQQNASLQNQLKAMSDIPGRNALDRRIRDLNQKNLTAQIQLDQERARVEDLRKQLDEARDIKRGVLERGQSANLKVDLLNDELSQARGKSNRSKMPLLMQGKRSASYRAGGAVPIQFLFLCPVPRMFPVILSWVLLLQFEPYHQESQVHRLWEHPLAIVFQESVSLVVLAHYHLGDKVLRVFKIFLQEIHRFS